MMQFFEQNSLYVVLVITLIIWLGISVYLFNLDSRLKRIEKAGKIEESEE